MEIRRSGSQSSAKGLAQYFTGDVRIGRTAGMLTELQTSH